MTCPRCNGFTAEDSLPVEAGFRLACQWSRSFRLSRKIMPSLSEHKREEGNGGNREQETEHHQESMLRRPDAEGLENFAAKPL